MNKFDDIRIFSSDLDKEFFGAGVAIIMDNVLAHHVFKVEKISSWVILVHLLFKDKLSVTILGLYAGVSSEKKFSQALEVNSFITRALNSSTFVVLGGNFNENNSKKSASFRFCLDLGLANLFNAHLLVRASMWSNLWGIEKTIDYIFVNDSLSSAVADQIIASVSDYFDTNHRAVVVSVGLGGLLDVQLNDQWKFKIAGADGPKWACFKEYSSVRFSSVSKEFLVANIGFVRSNVLLTNNLQNFFKLELLVAKLMKSLQSNNASKSGFLLNAWLIADKSKALEVQNMLNSSASGVEIFVCLSRFRKSYHCSKIHETKAAEAATIRHVIDKKMENFCMNKGSMIRSILDKLFCKVVLDHLVVDDELILDSSEVKFKVDMIMKGWTRKQSASTPLSAPWARQYALLQYVDDNAFSGIMDVIDFDELFQVVKYLPDKKAAGLSDKIPVLWRKVWVSIIPKPYNWDGVLTNTCPIALIKTACKILSKILSDRISFAYSKFGVLYGDNFSVLHGTSTQSSIFAVGSVVENALEKGREVWLVLQDMHKAYDLVGWYYLEASLWHVKMYDRFIEFFGEIHKDRFNCVIMDFGLSNDYQMLNGLD
ncbi:hypothetical protein G9A89_011302 [Geosiphon pyriformis]|nr:hypothetical protein G9A89_011302 [Geosiphon pyriformis]